MEEREDGIYVELPVEDEHVRTVTDVMAETLVSWGIDAVFGMVGHSNLGLADALRRQELAGKLRYFGIRHEGAAAFAASGYAKLTGRPAACFTIAGPGATNMITGMYDAKVDRVPLLALAGQVDTQVLGPGAFQEVDLAAAFAPVCTWRQTVQADSKHAELASLAVKHAIVERDVTGLVFPDEVQTIPAEDVPAGGPEGRLATPRIAPDPAVLDEALALMRDARRPVLVVGHGARFEMDAILRLAEQWNAPVLTTFKGKGLVPDAHPLACGVLGRSGTSIASWFMNEADLLVVLGASFSNHTGITPKIPTIQVDSDRMALGRFHPIQVPVWGELSLTVDQMAAGLAGRASSLDVRPEIAERWAIWRREKASRAGDDRGQGVNSAAIFATLGELVPEDAVLSVDVGNNTYSFGRYFECKQQSVLMSGYLGSIGFGFPAAMGAWAAAPERKIVSISGDGGFGQYMGELTTAVKYRMPITHVLLNNSCLGKIAKEQRAGEWDVWETNLTNPSFADYATSCGALGLRVEGLEGLRPALEAALAHTEGPSLVEILTDPELI